MKKNNPIHYGYGMAILIAIVLFLVPFFWLKPGFVNLGGDAGRHYFIDPYLSAKYLFMRQDFVWAPSHAIIAYEMFLALLHRFIISPTDMIAFDHAVQLALAFLSIFLIVREVLYLLEERFSSRIECISIAGGLMYVGMVANGNWALSLPSLNQIFLNPLLFFLLLRYCLKPSFWYILAILSLTILYSGNFGFSSMPQLMSFYPLALGFLLVMLIRLFKKTIPWRGLIILPILFLGLHGFHIVPTIMSIFDKSTMIHDSIFSVQTIQNSGIHYFDYNHFELGKISLQMFQPSQWNGQTLLILLVPCIAVLGFLKKPSKLLTLIGIFFAITLFLVSANITTIGVWFYRMLFSIPGFMMFRSFNEKWYFVFSFFSTLLFGVSFYLITRNRSKMFPIFLGVCVMGSIIFRIFPFLHGRNVSLPHWQSQNVSTAFTLDPDLMEAISSVRTLPDDGNVLTLPLTFPYMQVAYGKEGGAYVGVSMVQYLGGRKDFPGFWSFGPYQKTLFDTLRKEDVTSFIQLLSIRNIRYIFHNADTRIMEDFPGYPYVYPGELYYSKDIIPAIVNQSAYTTLLSRLPIEERFHQGFYTIYELESAVVRPTVYIPDVLYASGSGALSGFSYRSAFGDEKSCETAKSVGVLCDGSAETNLPQLSFTKASHTSYNVTIDLKERKDPFLVILSEDFHSSWEMKVDGTRKNLSHIPINGYANAWILDPKTLPTTGVLKGTITLGFEQYYTYGWTISMLTGAGVVALGIYFILRKRR